MDEPDGIERARRAIAIARNATARSSAALARMNDPEFNRRMERAIVESHGAVMRSRALLERFGRPADLGFAAAPGIEAASRPAPGIPWLTAAAGYGGHSPAPAIASPQIGETPTAVDDPGPHDGPGSPSPRVACGRPGSSIIRVAG
jgi:hypothetical protein